MSVFTPKYTIPFFRSGVPTDGELLGKHIFREHVRFLPGDFILATSDVAFTAETILPLTFTAAGTTSPNVPFASVTFPAGGTVGVGVLVSELYVDMLDGDTLRARNATPGDLTGADISMTILGVRVEE